jgi:hypothetical protein
MEKLLKKGNSNIISQIHVIQAVETPSPIVHPNMQFILSKHRSVFDNCYEENLSMARGKPQQT